MCLFHILDCSASNASELRRMLTRPSPEIIAAGLVRCKWHQAITRRSNADAKFQDPGALCPYVVVRHDQVPLPADQVKDLVEAVYLGRTSRPRGCRKCEETITNRKMLGPIPTSAEKADYLTALREVEATLSSPALAGGAAAPGKRRIGSLNVSDDAGLLGLATQGLHSSTQRSQGSGVSNALQRRKEELGIAMSTHLSIVARRSRSRQAVHLPPEKKGGPTGQSQKQGKEKESRVMGQQPGLNTQRHNYIDLTASSTITPSRSQTEPAVLSMSATAEHREKNIKEHVADAFTRLDHAAAQQKDGTPTHGTVGTQQDAGEFGIEILRAVRDGSFQAAVEEHVSRQHWAIDAPTASASSSSKVGGGGGGGRTGTGKVDMLIDSVRMLRAEKAGLIDRVAGLLDEKAASVEREAVLLRRVAELERLVQGQVNDSVKGKEKEKGAIWPSPSPQAP
ncbi:uncharacterized protein Z520_01174 [Fonsecaea multimorphosa CBS 102226]|uniref:Uncharacterized protein n=1 Tax=Fonsecaea multimorphosa CBS 102226 TaxID=1442371 RepID=A0A0D2L0Z7_9EURO|nr:uncharacterized protein Z520_01174 [Fonsecaea multimorphosa CBS 102226]KIY02709.1 hypothetical protein Z520_01174 [Fonsecaea multimorphosa CBS 102226]OAL31570.1 hypothetical protein AYO22_01162 [Fonsecaea multimorphosa]